jgi:hypothetical protein
MNVKIQNALNSIIEIFESGNIPEKQNYNLTPIQRKTQSHSSLFIELPEFPLMNRAKELGAFIKILPRHRENACLGYYNRPRNEIVLLCKDEDVFFHELAHHVHFNFVYLRGTQNHYKEEIIASLSALVLCRLNGTSEKNYIGNDYFRIKGYAYSLKMKPVQACVKFLDVTQKVLNIILVGEQESKKIISGVTG